MGAGATPAGWYPDVERPGGERYWDGSLWTEHRRSASEAGSGFPSRPPDAGSPSPFDQPPGSGPLPTSGQQPPMYGQSPYGQSPYGQSPYGQPAGGGFGQQPAFGSPAGYTPYGAPGTTYPPSSSAAWALGLSIAGLVLSVCCIGFVLAIPGTIMGWTTMQAIDRGEKDPNQRGTAKTAFIVGVIGLVVAVAWIVLIAIGSFV